MKPLTFRDPLWSEQVRRIQHIHNACADPTLFANETFKRKSSRLYYYSPKYNFSYCKVPKAGCSFWTQIFTVLGKGSEVANKVFGIARDSIHRRLTSQNRVKFSGEERRNSRSILISRDPYSRLYSAFVDKIFLRGFPRAMVQIKQRQGKERGCHSNLTFQDFLNDVTQTALSGKLRNRHWMPIVSLCYPCNVNPLAIVKVESFSADTEFALKEIGIAKDEFKVIHNMLHDNRLEATISSLIRSVLMDNSGGKGCRKKTDIARNIWISFQIQGYLRDDIPFPADVVNSDKNAGSSDFLTDLILTTIREKPLSKEESKRQRHNALVKAYESIDKKTLEDLKIVYKQDFILFNYSLEPPSAQK